MKRKIISILIVLGLLVVLVAIPAQAATEEDIEESIEKGLAWLAGEQNGNGSWGDVGHTGLAVLKFEDRGYELAEDDPDIDGPFDLDYEYRQNVIGGLNYIFSQASEIAISNQNAGDPDTTGNGKGVSWSNTTYYTSIAMMAIAGSKAPFRTVSGGACDGWTYQEVLQEAVDYMAYSQADPPCDDAGGWSYSALNNSCGNDNSNGGYAALGLGYAQVDPFNCNVPGWVYTQLSSYCDWIQNDQGPDYVGDPNTPSFDGGSGYGHPTSWVNCLKTGNLLFEMVFVGDDKTTDRAQRAIAYIVRHWNDVGTGSHYDTGWDNPPHYQAMYCLMKGLESMVIIEPEDLSGIDWFDEMSTAIVNNQNADGSWPPGHWGDSILSTEWALLTLERVVPNRPPDCSEAYAEPACLWPPNHKFVDVSIMGVTDPDDDPVTITITGITSDEPTASDKGSGGAKHAPDADGIGTDTASVRAERSGNGDGRVYVIHFTANDGRGGECEGSVIVKVPHDQSVEDCPAVDSGQNYDATEIN